jgi:hypothetical protein
MLLLILALYLKCAFSSEESFAAAAAAVADCGSSPRHVSWTDYSWEAGYRLEKMVSIYDIYHTPEGFEVYGYRRQVQNIHRTFKDDGSLMDFLGLLIGPAEIATIGLNLVHKCKEEEFDLEMKKFQRLSFYRMEKLRLVKE